MRYLYRNSVKFFAAVLSIIVLLSISADVFANIGVGSTPTNRSTYCATASTYISLENPADFSGTISTVQIYSAATFSGIYIATFERLSSTSFRARDRQDVGSISTGLNTKTGLSIDVEPGDYIGFYNTSGTRRIDQGWFGGSGIMLNNAGDKTSPGTTATYYLYTSGSYPNAQGSFSISLYGTGTGEEEEDTDLVGTPTVYNSSGSASAVVSKPTGVAEDDIMFAHILHYNSTDRLNTIPDGWVEIGRHKNGSYNQALYYKVAGASEGASYTFGLSVSSKLAVTISAYRGNFDPSDPIDTFSNTEYVTSNTTYRAASLTLTNPNSTVLMFPSIYSGTVYTFNNPITQDAGWVEDYDHGSRSPDFSRAGYRKKIRASGATGVIDSIGRTGSTIKHAFGVALNIPNPNIPPTISSVSDSPDPQEGGSSISFSSISSDADVADTIELFICKDSSCVECGTATTSNCWASSSSAVSENASASFECQSCNESTVTLQNGWNLFSPSIAEGIDVSYMETAGCSLGAIYYWDPIAKSYKAESDHLDAGTGYWVAESGGGCTFSVSGTPWEFSSTAYNAGNHLIGSAYRSYKVSDLLGDCPSATVQTQVSGGAYTEVNVLHAWNAYWLTVPSNCNFGSDPSPSSYSPCPPYGDVDLDGDVDSDDSQLVLNYTTGGDLTEEQKIRANVTYDFLEDGSPKVTVTDAVVIAQYYEGVRNSFPVCGFVNIYNYWAKVCDSNDECSATTSLQSFSYRKEDNCSCSCGDGSCEECYGDFCCSNLCKSSECNSPPTITQVSDAPDPQEGGSGITFSSTSSDPNEGDTIELYICKDASCTDCSPSGTSNCWASSTSGVGTNASASYIANSCATSTNDYWAKVCDNYGLCSSTTTIQTFSVEKEDSCFCSGDGPSEECFGGYCCGGVCGSAGCSPTISTLAATSVGTSTAQINGELLSLAGEDSAYVWFKWGETESYGNETASSTMDSTGTFNASLSGLEQGQTYHFIAMAGNDNGTSSSIDLSFSTIDGCASHNISGWAWSENIGWVSFSCSNCDSDSNGYVDSGACGGDNSSTFSMDYGVDMDINSGILSGHAWSENVGWISFNYSETGSPPGSPDYSGSGYIAKTSTSTFESSGWARALSASSSDSGGWGGWVKLRKED